jgi:hypothetical protein
MIRSLLTIGRVAFRPLTVTQSNILGTPRIHFDFAKVPKRDQQAKDKKKEKDKVREEMGGNVEEIDMNVYE